MKERNEREGKGEKKKYLLPSFTLKVFHNCNGFREEPVRK